ncbi:hypothetical protein WG936_05355 [Corynebacterium sp. H127]|uniref:hypothetical protein n=1 Tax=Corynebacterium sp. H127 TaxID=3133418 RepID=UPI0030B243F5
MTHVPPPELQLRDAERQEQEVRIIVASMLVATAVILIGLWALPALIITGWWL